MKCLALTRLLTVSLILATVTSAHPQSRAQRTPEPAQSLEQFLKRWKDEKLNRLFGGAAWTLAHDYADPQRAGQASEIMATYFAALEQYENGAPATLDKLGGIKSFKDKMAALLLGDDQAVRAYAATALGVSGDRAYAAPIAELLKERKQAGPQPRYDRGRAATALGLLGAKEYIADLVALLSSANSFDRSGAVFGIGWMGAKEQTPAVARLLNDVNEDVREAVRLALEMMGATAPLKKTR